MVTKRKGIDKEKLMQDVYKRGYEMEQRYDGCAQCVVAALHDFFPVNSVLVKASTSFSGGIASTAAGPCGALTGGIMVLSYFFGRSWEDLPDKSLLRRPGPQVRAFWEHFNNTYNGDTCQAVQTHLFGSVYHFLDNEEYAQYEEAGGLDDKCPSVVGQSAAWVAELLYENNVPILKK